MERNFYVEITVNAKTFEVLHLSSILYDYQRGCDVVKAYVDYLRKWHPFDNATMIGSFTCPHDSTVLLLAITYINGEKYFLGLKKFTHYEN